MNPKIKMVAKILAVILVVVLTSFITRKFNDWYPPQTEIKIVFEGSRFASFPCLRPLKDKTTYYFKDCDFPGKELAGRFGDYIADEEVDEVINKLEKEVKK